ncbi:hypothetical protein K227x_24210 [Rubripirellula lacrimiformis]|uniref:Uncharacterized protein n=1 Tax=Rubripirellula lacrimiformis TaxID=1930273 RepID=A0A517NA69_9BACT|nr:hypothetical protein K227x_24210 [Rubripirellula lacrimiformis]
MQPQAQWIASLICIRRFGRMVFARLLSARLLFARSLFGGTHESTVGRGAVIQNGLLLSAGSSVDGSNVGGGVSGC